MFAINVDRRLDKSTVQKGVRIAPLLKMWEVNRPGVARWPSVKAQGKLTIALQPLDGEGFIVDGKAYTFKTVLTEADGYVKIGGTLAQTQANVMAAVNLSGVPGSQYASMTSLHPSAEVTQQIGNDLVFTAKNGGVAGNTISVSETMTGAGNQWDASTLGTYRAGAAESDADSYFSPHFYGGFSPPRTSGPNNSGSAIIESDPIEGMFHIGKASDSGNGNDSRAWGNNTNLISDFPSKSYKLLAGAVRKIWQLNYFDRRHTNLRVLGLNTFFKRLTPVVLNSPYAENTSNIVFKTIELDSTRFVAFFKQAATTAGTYAVAGQTAADGSITWGNPLLLDDDQYTNENFDAVLINTDKLLFSMRNGASNYVFVNTLSVSTLALSITTPVQVAAVVSDRKAMVKVGTDKALIAFPNGANMNIYVVSVSGVTPSIGSSATITGGSQPIFAENGTDKAQILYIFNGFWYTAVISVSGTTPVANPGVKVSNTGSFSFKGQNLWKIDVDKYLLYIPEGNLMPYRGRTRMKLGIITVSGINPTLVQSSITELIASEYDSNITFLKNLSGVTDWIFYRFTGSYLRGARITISGTTISIQDRMLEGSGYRDNNGEYPSFVQEEFNNIPQIGDPVLSTYGTFFICTNNNENGAFNYWADKSFNFDLYLDDDYYGTFTKTLPALTEPIPVVLPLFRDEFGIKIKSNDSQDRYVIIDHAYVAID